MQFDGMTPQDPAAATKLAVEAAVAGTDGLDTVPLAEHVARFDAVHVALNDALSRIDTD
ncbi:hypothetical protein [Actinophytocola sp.]|uniref:hypothetical protein n=1 Tax=Actinophytocola sp. TaxID=1872138 RepID=UPI002ED89EC5